MPCQCRAQGCPTAAGPTEYRGAYIAACLLLATLTPCSADPAPVIHCAPGENLEHIDVALIDRAEHEIDMATYVLTDWPVMQALKRAADRGVKVQIYLDGGQLAEREPAKIFNDLAETPGVEIRTNTRPARRYTSRATRLTGDCMTFKFPARGQDMATIVVLKIEKQDSGKVRVSIEARQ